MTPLTSSRSGRAASSVVMSTERKSTSPRASAPGATPNDSNQSLRMSRTGFIRSLRSAALEVPAELPVRDGRVVEDDLLLHRGVEQVLEDEIPEGLSRHLRVLERLDR